MKFKNMFWIVFLFFVVIPCLASVELSCHDEPSQTGPCKAAMPSWRYIKPKRKCEFFLYGGCQATRNIFDDEEECKRLCLR